MTTRTDHHAPASIIPADYEHLLEYGREYASWDGEVFFEEWTGMPEATRLYEADGVFIHGPQDDPEAALLRCDICGARFKYGSLFRHVSGEVISVGHDCADGLNLAYDRAAAERIQGRFARLRKSILDRRARWAAYREVFAEAPELRALFRTDHRIVRDIRARFVANPHRARPTERQVALLEKLAQQSVEANEAHVPVPVDGERIEIVGTVVAVKPSASYYADTIRMTVKVETPEGSWLVNGTAPDALLAGTLKGSLVRFRAKVTPGGRDPHFGFFKRPTKAEVLAEPILTREIEAGELEALEAARAKLAEHRQALQDLTESLTGGAPVELAELNDGQRTLLQDLGEHVGRLAAEVERLEAATRPGMVRA